MESTRKDLDREEKTIKELAEDIKPAQDGFPKSAAEATTAPLQGDELGQNADGDGHSSASIKDSRS